MTAHIEHLTHEIDIVRQEDGTWRAIGYPTDGARPKISRFKSYFSRATLLFALRNDPDFWEDDIRNPRPAALGIPPKGASP